MSVTSFLRKQKWGKAHKTLLVIGLVFLFVVPSVLDIFQPKTAYAADDPSIINLMAGNGLVNSLASYDDGKSAATDSVWTKINCQAQIVPGTLDDATIKKALNIDSFGKYVSGNANEWVAALKGPDAANVWVFNGKNYADKDLQNYFNWLKANYNKPVYNLAFSNPGCGASGETNHFLLVPVQSKSGTDPTSANVWVAVQYSVDVGQWTGVVQNMMRFTARGPAPQNAQNVVGTLEYYQSVSAGGKFMRGHAVTEPNFIAGGNTNVDVTGNGSSGDPQVDECASLGDFEFKWLLCPIITATTKFANFIDGIIQSQLTYNTALFNRNGDNGKAFYAAWSNFRNIGLALMLIVSLVMVITQALGMEVFTAYSVRKTLPRLLAAAIGITLSWFILEFVVTFFNDMGNWMVDIVLYPFRTALIADLKNSGIQNPVLSDLNTVLGFGQMVSIALTTATGAVILMGAMGALSFIATFLLAILVGLLVLAVRTAIITITILTAPLAIACWILPGTQKVWNFWKDAFVTSLMVFPIIMLFIAAGRILSLVTDSKFGVVKLLFLIMPYALLPLTFKLAGGLMQTVFSIANDKGRGAFDRLKQYRGNSLKENTQKLMAGQRWSGKNAFTAGLNQLSGDFGAMATSQDKGSWLNPFRHMSAEGRSKALASRNAARQIHSSLTAAQYGESAMGKAIKDNDPALWAKTYLTEAEARIGLRRDWGLTDPDRINEAIAAAKITGGFSKGQQVNAVGALFATGTGIENAEQAQGLIARVAGNNRQLASALAGYGNAVTKSVGRHDLALSYGKYMDLYDKNVAGTLNDRDIQEAKMQVFKDNDLSTLMRGKARAVGNNADTLREEINYQLQQSVNGRTQQERDAAKVEAAKWTGVINSLPIHKTYSSAGNIEIVDQRVIAPTEKDRAKLVAEVQRTVRQMPHPDAQTAAQGGTVIVRGRAAQALNTQTQSPYASSDRNTPGSPLAE